MAGHRRESGKPMVRTVKAEKRLANLNAALASTDRPQDRVAVAADHLRWVLVRHPDDDVADNVVEQLIAAANRLQNKRGARR